MTQIHPQFFATQLDFRKWLEENQDKKSELYVGLHKVNSGLQSMTWSESVEGFSIHACILSKTCYPLDYERKAGIHKG